MKDFRLNQNLDKRARVAVVTKSVTFRLSAGLLVHVAADI